MINTQRSVNESRGTTSRRTWILSAAVALALAACSGSDDATDSAPLTSAAADVTAPTATETPVTKVEPDTTVAPEITVQPETTLAPETTAAPETTVVPEPACPTSAPNETAQPAGIVASFDRQANEIPEGVAVDTSGNVYMSFAALGQIVRFAPGSSDYEVVATVPDWDLDLDTYFVDHYGILGLIVDADGDLYASVDTPGRGGVWKFDCGEGEGARIDGTEAMLFANGMAFDDDGNLFVTESFSGREGDVPLDAIWKITPDGAATKWLEDITLGGPNQFELPKPIGANGIAINDDVVYVANSQQTSIFTVPVLADGSPGEVEPYLVTESAIIPGGLILDAEGRVYVTDVLTNSVVRVKADGTIVPIAGGVDSDFQAPRNMAFGTGATLQTLYVISVGQSPNERTNPALHAVDVHTPGMPRP